MNEMAVDNGGGRERKVRVNYPSNANKTKLQPVTSNSEEDKPKNEKIVTGDVIRRKSAFGGIGNNMNGVLAYILTDVLVPAAKNMLVDAVKEGIDRIVYGESRNRNRGERQSYVSYNRIRPNTGTSTYGANEPRNLSRTARATHAFEEVILRERAEAENVIDKLVELVDRYEQATVSDLYELLGITGSFTDDKWGWTDLRDARVKAVRGGYLLDLPRTEPID